jgi:hypothetical protein
MGNTPVEVQFTSAGCLNYPCRTSDKAKDERWRRFVWMPGDLKEVDEHGDPIKKEEPKLEVSDKKKPDENDDNY